MIFIDRSGRGLSAKEPTACVSFSALLLKTCHSAQKLFMGVSAAGRERPEIDAAVLSKNINFFKLFFTERKIAQSTIAVLEL